MANFLADLVEELAGEPVDAIVIGAFPKDDGPRTPRDIVPREAIGRVSTWSDAVVWLDYDYDDDVGSAPDGGNGADCHPVYIYTATRVIVINEYDGSTRPRSVPRHPVACAPSFIRGGCW